jgi:hypothetical protein
MYTFWILAIAPLNMFIYMFIFQEKVFCQSQWDLSLSQLSKKIDNRWSFDRNILFDMLVTCVDSNEFPLNNEKLYFVKMTNIGPSTSSPKWQLVWLFYTWQFFATPLETPIIIIMFNIHRVPPSTDRCGWRATPQRPFWIYRFWVHFWKLQCCRRPFHSLAAATEYILSP